jgi:hypothetical protein
MVGLLAHPDRAAHCGYRRPGLRLPQRVRDLLLREATSASAPVPSRGLDYAEFLTLLLD